MSGFVLHPDAYQDLDELWEYIAADNPEAADRILDEIYTAIQTLVSFPQVGHVRPTLLPAQSAFTLCASICSPTLPTKSLCSCLRFFTAAVIRGLWRRFCAPEKSNLLYGGLVQVLFDFTAGLTYQLHRGLAHKNFPVKLLAPA